MFNKKVTLILALLVLAVFAIGSVSASDDIATDSDVPDDDIAVDDVSSGVSEEQDEEVTSHDVTNSTSIADINTAISDASSDSSNHVVNFEYGTYYNASFTVQNNVVLDGHGSTLIGDGTNDIFLVTQKSNFIIKNFIINVNNNASGHGIYGHHVTDSIITNNTIYNCSDAINIYQIHENLTITDNTIYDFDGDGISLVNFYDYLNDDEGFADFVGSTVTGNNITGGAFGMFFGGNFKGTISENIITGSDVGIEFKGKKLASNGCLDLDLIDNIISNVHTGINMFNPGVDWLYAFNNTITTTNESGEYAILTNGNFIKIGYISVFYNEFNGQVTTTFGNATDYAEGNTGVGANAFNQL